MDKVVNETIKPFQLSSFIINTTAVIIGATHSGKTSLMKWEMYNLRHKFRFCIVVSKTADANMEYLRNVPDTFIYTKYPSKIIKELLAKQAILARLKKMKDPRVENMNINVLLILDDILSDNQWKKDENVKDLVFNGRHFAITTFIIIQDQLGLPREFRGQLDYIFAFRMQSDEEKKRIYKYYWDSAFGDYRTFLDIMDKCTENRKCLVINNQNRTSTVFNEKISYCKTRHPSEIPEFKIGEAEVWKLHEKEYDQDWWKKISSKDKEEIEESLNKDNKKKKKKSNFVLT